MIKSFFDARGDDQYGTIRFSFRDSNVNFPEDGFFQFEVAFVDYNGKCSTHTCHGHGAFKQIISAIKAFYPEKGKFFSKLRLMEGPVIILVRAKSKVGAVNKMYWLFKNSTENFIIEYYKD